MKTFSAKPHEVQRAWFVVDATDKVLGRVAAERILQRIAQPDAARQNVIMPPQLVIRGSA